MLSARRMTISWGLFERSTAGFVYTVCGFRVLRRLCRFCADDICYCRLTAGWVPHLDVSGIFIPCRSRDFCWFLTIEYGFPILNERTDAYDSIRSHEVFRDLTDRGESKIQFDMTRWCGLALPINEWEISSDGLIKLSLLYKYLWKAWVPDSTNFLTGWLYYG
jgi:hypothetical protein